MNVVELSHRLERDIVIEAPPDLVFRFFTDSERWASWWGAGSTIDARTGGHMLIRYPNGVEATGEVLDVAPPDRIVFTYGYASGKPIPVGGSRVTISLDRAARGTRLLLTHEFADASLRDAHEQGWRYQLSVFANLVSNELHRNAADLVDAWFAAAAVVDDDARRQALSTIAVDDIRVRDRFSSITGMTELCQHLAGFQRFMPGVTIRRAGDVRHCQGTALVDFSATGADGSPRGRGTSVFQLAPDGRIELVTSLWS